MILMPWLNLQATQAHGLFLGLPVMYVARASGCPTSLFCHTMNSKYDSLVSHHFCSRGWSTFSVQISSDFSKKRIQKVRSSSPSSRPSQPSRPSGRPSFSLHRLHVVLKVLPSNFLTRSFGSSLHVKKLNKFKTN